MPLIAESDYSADEVSFPCKFSDPWLFLYENLLPPLSHPSLPMCGVGEGEGATAAASPDSDLGGPRLRDHDRHQQDHAVAL